MHYLTLMNQAVVEKSFSLMNRIYTPSAEIFKSSVTRIPNENLLGGRGVILTKGSGVFGCHVQRPGADFVSMQSTVLYTGHPPTYFLYIFMMAFMMSNLKTNKGTAKWSIMDPCNIKHCSRKCIMLLRIPNNYVSSYKISSYIQFLN